jgi:hypothetical protein
MQKNINNEEPIHNGIKPIVTNGSKTGIIVHPVKEIITANPNPYTMDLNIFSPNPISPSPPAHLLISPAPVCEKKRCLCVISFEATGMPKGNAHRGHRK